MSKRHRDRRLVLIIEIAALVVTILTTTAEPTGYRIIDLAWCSAFVVGTSYMTSRSSRAPSLWLAGLATAGAIGGWWAIPAGVALIAAVFNAANAMRSRPLGALVGALSALALLHLSVGTTFGLATVVGVVATVPVIISGYRRSPGGVQIAIERTALVVGGVVVVAVIGLGVSVLLSRNQLNTAVDQARGGLDSIRDGDQEGGASQLDESSRSFTKASRDFDGLLALPSRALPVVSQHAQALSTAASAGAEVTSTAAAAARSAPYQQLKASGGSLDLATIVEMQEPTADAAAALQTAADDLDAVQTPWLAPPASNELQRFQDEIEEALPQAKKAAQALAVAPELLGANGDRNYLVLFTSPSEARNLGGFTGSYGVLTASGGHVTFEGGKAITDVIPDSGIDPASVVLDATPEFVERYGRYQPNVYLQNLTVSPDMNVTADMAGSIFEQVTGTTIDGVMVVDPFAIAALLELTGPVQVEGLDKPLNSKNAIDYLLHDQYIEFEGETAERKDRLEAAGTATFDALVARDLPGPKQLGKVLGPVVDGKNLMFHPFDPAALDLMRALGVAGDMAPDLSGDVVAVKTANARPNKLDYYLHRGLDYDARFDPDTGSVASTVTVTLRNDAPAEGEPAYILGRENDPIGLPPGTSVEWVSIYSPLDLSSAAVGGLAVDAESHNEFGIHSYTVRVDIPPGQTSTLVLELNGTVPPNSTYGLQVLSQPLVHDEAFTLRVESASAAWSPRPTKRIPVKGDTATYEGKLTKDETFSVEFERR